MGWDWLWRGLGQVGSRQKAETVPLFVRHGSWGKGGRRGYWDTSAVKATHLTMIFLRMPVDRRVILVPAKALLLSMP